MRNDSPFAKLIKLCALFASLLCALLILLYSLFEHSVILSLAITAGTTAYHFVMRLTVGWLVTLITRGQLPSDHFWFRQRPFERRLYRLLRVRKWKGKMPTYAPEKFSFAQNSPEQIIRNSCEAELVHEIIAVASFLPLLATFQWGAFPVFLISSILAAALDCCFAIMQRYNRPRLQQYLKRYKAKSNT